VVRVTVSDDGGTSWNGVDLPVADPELSALAGGDGRVLTQIAGVAGSGDVTLVLVRQQLALDDAARLITEAGFDPARYGIVPDGLTCDVTTAAAITVAPPADDAGSATSVPAAPPAVSTVPPPGGCEGSSTLIPWSDLGDAGVRLQAAASPTSRLFASADGSTFQEVPLPGGAAGELQLLGTGGSVVLTSTGQGFGPQVTRLWRTTDGQGWEPIETPSATFTGFVRQLGDRLVSVAWDERGATPFLLEPGGAWQQLDLAPLLGEGRSMLHPSLATSSAGLTMVAAVGGPDDGTGGNAVRWELLQTADGLTWSRQSVAELAGLQDADISAVTRVQAAGSTVVVAVSLAAGPDEVPEQLVLVGTPNG
jgi:hypothetical protein